jgi:hypothetical protein
VKCQKRQEQGAGRRGGEKRHESKIRSEVKKITGARQARDVIQRRETKSKKSPLLPAGWRREKSEEETKERREKRKERRDKREVRRE